MLKINELARLYLGVKGENNSRTIEIDMSAWAQIYPNATAVILHKRNGDQAKDLTGATYDSETKVLSWITSAYDTFYDGFGVAEVRMVEGDVVKKTKDMITTVTSSSLTNGSGQIVESTWQAFLNDVISTKGEAEAAQEAAEAAQEAAEEAQEKAEDAVTHAPYVDSTTGNWMVWDWTEEDYVDTGVHAKGDKGDQGDPGSTSIDDTTTARNKLWSSNKTNTEISAKYTKPGTGIPATDLASAVQTSLGKADSAYQKPETGIPAADMASGVIPVLTDLIDDTAGVGDTDKVFSAGKLTSDFSDVLNAIQQKADEPTGTKSAGKVYGLTNVNGTATPTWVDQEAGSFVPVFTNTNGDWSCDKTYAEVLSAIQAGNCYHCKIDGEISNEYASLTDANTEDDTISFWLTVSADGIINAREIRYYSNGNIESWGENIVLTEIIAPSFFELSYPIEMGTICYYYGQIYRANQTIPQEEQYFDYGHWDIVSVTELISEKSDKADTVLTTTLSRGRKANTTVGTASFAFGDGVEASNYQSFAVGYNTVASGANAHAEGGTTTASGAQAHAEGGGTTASGVNSHAEGAGTTASGAQAHAEGAGTTASGFQAHVEGTGTTASGASSHSEGNATTASGSGSHAEGNTTIASGAYSHVVGSCNIEDSYDNWDEWVSGTSYAVGDKVKRTTTYNNVTTVEGYICKTANSDSSFKASKWYYQFGKMNYVEIVGNGTETNARSNARTLDWFGNERIAGDLYVHCNTDSTGGTKVPYDVQVNGTSVVSNGVASIPMADTSNYGAVKIKTDYGVSYQSGCLCIRNASEALCKGGTNIWRPITPSVQNASTFYGLASASGDTTQSASSNAVGVYTDNAKKMIRKMLGLPQDWELIADVTTTQDLAELAVTTDSNGDAFALSEMFTRVYLPQSTTGTQDYIKGNTFATVTGASGSSWQSLSSARYSSATSTSVLEYTHKLICGVCVVETKSGSSANNTQNLGRLSFPEVNTSTIESINGIRLLQYNSSSTLIPSGTRIMVYGRRII